ncbi:MAG: hypothetical protein IJ246_08745 [Clostridia bacterium]|nr:hypothetical protein [Clostridia bacterium]
MQKKLGETCIHYLWPALVLLLIAGFFTLCQSRMQTDFPVLRPADGVLDAREVDFSGCKPQRQKNRPQASSEHSCLRSLLLHGVDAFFSVDQSSTQMPFCSVVG